MTAWFKAVDGIWYKICPHCKKCKPEYDYSGDRHTKCLVKRHSLCRECTNLKRRGTYVSIRGMPNKVNASRLKSRIEALTNHKCRALAREFDVYDKLRQEAKEEVLNELRNT